MSDSEAKARRAKLKDAKQSLAPAKSVGKAHPKPKKRKPFRVQFKFFKYAKINSVFLNWGKDWTTWGNYTKLEGAQQAVGAAKQSRWWEDVQFRIVDTRTDEEVINE